MLPIADNAAHGGSVLSDEEKRIGEGLPVGEKREVELAEVIRMGTNIEQLIQELCPNGVPFLPLGDLVRIRNGKDYKSYAEGGIPVYGSGGVIASIATSVHSGPSVLIPRKGSLNKLYYVDSPFWTVDTIFYTEIGEKLLPKFFYYYLLTCHLEDLNQAGGVPSLTQTILNKIAIPVPPVEVQEEIVRILDLFTTLEAELEAELEKRVAQYAYYQQLLIGASRSGGDDYSSKTVYPSIPLKELGTWHGGSTPSKSRDEYWLDGEIPWVSPKDMSSPLILDSIDHVTQAAINKTSLRLIPENAICLVVRSSILDKQLPVAKTSVPITINQDLKALIPSEGVEPNYVYHALKAESTQILKAARKSGGSVASLNTKQLFEFKIVIPPIEEQRRIASILDQMDALVNDLSSGLPAEIAARRKQYEYYRDRLLSFPELTEPTATASPNTQETTLA